jgi:hypothetical protein
MSVVVEFEEGAVVVKQPEKGRSIIVSSAAWLKLIKLKKEVAEAIEKKEEKKWSLFDDLFVHTTVFNDNLYVHIRKWFKERPTTNGVALYPDQWKKLCMHLVESDEMKLVREVVQSHIAERLKKLIADRCEGCAKEWGSQKDHDCLMNGLTLAQAHIEDAAKPMSYQKLLLKLAQLGIERKVSIRYPWLSHVTVLSLYLKDIKKEVVDTYNY